jgi:hypothetical protein
VTRSELADELASVRKTSRAITWMVWTCAAGVMVYGIPIVYKLLTDHGNPASTAWLISLCADLALAVGLVATPVLARHELKSGWVGSLRWISGIIILCLQGLEPLTRKGGPDWVGVITHVVGPILLFGVIEAAASFQREMGGVIAVKERQLAELDQHTADERSATTALRRELAEAQQRLQQAAADAAREQERLTLEARREAGRAAAEIERLTAQIASGGALREQEVGSLTERARFAEATVADLRGRVESLRADLSAAQDKAAYDLAGLEEKLTVEYNDEIRRLKETHAAALAEGSTVKLADYRSGTRRVKEAPAPAAPLSDADAVEKMLTAHGDPDFEWSQAEVRRVTGVGFQRAQKLIPLWLEAATVQGSTGDGEASA